MTIPSQPLPTLAQVNSTEDPKTRNALAELQAILTGNIDSANIADGSIALGDLAAATKNSFLKLLTVGDRKVAFGSANGATAVAGNLISGTIAHGLGVTPVFAIAQIVDGSSIGAVNAVCTGVKVFDATNLTFYFQGINSASVTGGAVNFFWLAIG